MAKLRVEPTVRDAFETYRDNLADLLVLGGLAWIVPAAAAVGVLIVVWGASVLALFGASSADPAQIEQLLRDVIGDPETFSVFLTTLLGGVVAAVTAWTVVWTLFYGGLLARVRAAADAARDVSDALRVGASRLVPLLGVTVTMTAIAVGLVALPGGFAAWGVFQAIQSGSPSAAFMTAGLGVLLLLIGGLVFLALAVVFFVAPPAVVYEELGTVDAFRRSWGLTEGHRLLVFVLVLVGVAAGWIVNFGLGLALTPFSLAGIDTSLVQAAASGVLTAPVWPLLSAKAFEHLTGQRDDTQATAEPSKAPRGGYVPVDSGQAPDQP